MTQSKCEATYTIILTDLQDYAHLLKVTQETGTSLQTELVSRHVDLFYRAQALLSAAR
jgi:hypothetical protein